MKQVEGVVRYQLDFEFADLPERSGLDPLIAWRATLHRLGLLGQDPSRYQGLGYGNVSLRTGAESFLISGTQTGKLRQLPGNQFAEVCSFDLPGHRLQARGRVKPSSEALTHGAVYRLRADIACVLHVHSAEIWSRTERLGLPCTPAATEYGSAEMAAAVADLYARTPVDQTGVFSMLGHSDGVVAFGPDPQAAGSALLKTLKRSVAIEQPPQSTEH